MLFMKKLHIFDRLLYKFLRKTDTRRARKREREREREGEREREREREGDLPEKLLVLNLVYFFTWILVYISRKNCRKFKRLLYNFPRKTDTRRERERERDGIDFGTLFTWILQCFS